MSRPKEPFFFEAEHEQGVQFYSRKYFSTWSGQRIVGESRHRNLYLPFVPSRIHRFNRDAKLLVVLRDPVERAISHCLAEALRADMERIEAGHKFTTDEDAATDAKLIYQDFRSPHQTYLVALAIVQDGAALPGLWLLCRTDRTVPPTLRNGQPSRGFL